MKQVLQNQKTGLVEVADVPCPAIRPGHLLLRTRVSLISAGTERATLESGRQSLAKKALRSPEKALQVLDRARMDGLGNTVGSIRSAMDRLQPLGYCNVGEVVETAVVSNGFTVGQRIASNGHHAEFVSVPANLCAAIPDSVSDEAAAFTVMGAIALQGIRLAQPTLGETFVVSGLGLVGLLTVQLLRAHGCRVIGTDFITDRLTLGQSFAAEVIDLSRDGDPVTSALTLSRGRGVDGVIVAADTASNAPVHQAANMCRKRGRIVLVGVTGLDLAREDFFEKELSFQVSCSYGPGRYDPSYEDGGHDYPLAFVRWTEQRNFEAVLDMLADGKLDVSPLISHRLALTEADRAYGLVESDGATLGVLFLYPGMDTEETDARKRPVILRTGEARVPRATPQPTVAVIGAGAYATTTLMPALKAAGVRLRSVVSRDGLSATRAGRRFGFEQVATDFQAVFSDPDVDTVIIATHHDSHPSLAAAGLAAGKHIFVEKPLAINHAGLAEVRSAYEASGSAKGGPLLMVGFNRRFSPHIGRARELLGSVPGPCALVVTVNAGALPAGHWADDPATGGGRFIGEGCHFLDLMLFLAGSPVVSVQATRLSHPGAGSDGSTCVVLTFSDGSIGTLNYLCNGHSSFPKERLEIFSAGRILALDDFRDLSGFGWPGFRRHRTRRRDKGNAACVTAFVEAIRRGEAAPVPFDELIASSELTLRVADAIIAGHEPGQEC